MFNFENMTNQGIIRGTESSFWLEMCPATNFSTLKEGLKVDVAILGGGIAGITTATLLKEAGYNVAVIEIDRIVKDVTVGTTAKISVSASYSILRYKLGKRKAQAYANANIQALEKIAEIVRVHKIECEFHRLPLYIYNETSEQADKFKREFKLTKELGLPVSYTNDVPLPFKTGPSIRYDNQAQFHPRKYLLSLSEYIEGDGSYIFEKTRVINVKEGDIKEIVTDHGSIMADKVVIATHTPVYDPDELHSHLHPERSYVIGLYAKGDFPDGMFVENEPVHTYRTTPTDNGKMIIVAGEHSPVDVEDKTVYYKRLEKYACDHLDVKSVEYRWSNRDSITDDGLPIIGSTSKDGVYVAAGFGFWGMSNGTTAGMVITDLITGKENQYADIFNPLRFTRRYMAILKMRSAILSAILFFMKLNLNI